MWFDVGQPCLRRRAADGTSRGGSSPTCMFKMSSWQTCWGVSTAFSLRRRAPTNVSVEKKKKSLVCYFGLHLWKLHLSESACWNTTFFCDVTTGQRCLSQFRDHTSDPRDPFRGPRPGVCSTGRDGRAATFPIMREVFTGGELKRFFDRGCKQRANYAVSLRSADLVLLN